MSDAHNQDEETRRIRDKNILQDRDMFYFYLRTEHDLSDDFPDKHFLKLSYDGGYQTIEFQITADEFAAFNRDIVLTFKYDSRTRSAKLHFEDEDTP